METLLDVMVKFFNQENWPFTRLNGKDVLRLGFQGKNGSWFCYAQAREEQKIILFHSVCPVNVPEDKRSLVAEFLIRSNYGMLVGNFELDYTDGEVRFKTGVDVEGTELTIALVHNLVYVNVLMMDRYLPGIMAVLYGDLTPEGAVNQVESAKSR
jgi:hypothetical protein